MYGIATVMAIPHNACTAVATAIVLLRTLVAEASQIITKQIGLVLSVLKTCIWKPVQVGKKEVREDARLSVVEDRNMVSGLLNSRISG